MSPRQFTAEDRAKALAARNAKSGKTTLPVLPPPVEPIDPGPDDSALSWPLPAREDWESMPVEVAHALIQKVQASYQEGATILNQRVYDEARQSGKYKCMVCQKVKPIVLDNHPNFVWEDHRKDPMTGVLVSRRICSSECYFRGSNQGKLTNAGTPGNVFK